MTNSDIMTVTTKYVVTDTKNLVSPAGYHPDTQVYKQTKIAIHTDSLNNLPKSNVPLWAHEMGQI